MSRSKVSVGSLLVSGLTLFTGQFLLLFFAFTEGVPAGLASVTEQRQVFFTVTLAACFLRDLPDLQQGIGLGVALAGLALIGLSTGADLKPAALALATAAAFSWAVGNILINRTSDVPICPLMVWASLVRPIPTLLVSGLYDQHSPLAAIADASWPVVYLATLVTAVAYGIWGYLLQP